MASDISYSIGPDPTDTDRVLVTEPSGRVQRIHRDDADPEHRHTVYRLAAGWFGNVPG